MLFQDETNESSLGLTAQAQQTLSNLLEMTATNPTQAALISSILAAAASSNQNNGNTINLSSAGGANNNGSNFSSMISSPTTAALALAASAIGLNVADRNGTKGIKKIKEEDMSSHQQQPPECANCGELNTSVSLRRHGPLTHYLCAKCAGMASANGKFVVKSKLKHF